MPQPSKMNLSHPSASYLPAVSIDCVLFGFNENQLNVLLLQSKFSKEWCLPGGFVGKDETLEDAATRILGERTGVDDVFLTQFRVFSELDRRNPAFELDSMNALGIGEENFSWLNQRFLSVGFYALVEFSKVNPMPDAYSSICGWRSIEEVGPLVMDHNQIFETALETLRLQLRYQPIGYNLLPEKFTMPELQKLYETILGRELDRRNFQRKMLSHKILKRLPERRLGVAYKAPFLYSFDLHAYEKALIDGLSGDW